MQRMVGNAAVTQVFGRSTPPSAVVQRDPIVMPPDEIKGQDPNIVHPPGGTINAGDKPDDETQKVMAAVGAAHTRG
jgi:hypothetical protein